MSHERDSQAESDDRGLAWTRAVYSTVDAAQSTTHEVFELIESGLEQHQEQEQLRRSSTSREVKHVIGLVRETLATSKASTFAKHARLGLENLAIPQSGGSSGSAAFAGSGVSAASARDAELCRDHEASSHDRSEAGNSSATVTQPNHQRPADQPPRDAGQHTEGAPPAKRKSLLSHLTESMATSQRGMALARLTAFSNALRTVEIVSNSIEAGAAANIVIQLGSRATQDNPGQQGLITPVSWGAGALGEKRRKDEASSHLCLVSIFASTSK